MSDSISRQAAIEALDGEIEVTGKANAKAVLKYTQMVSDRIKALPPVQPEQRWIPVTERLPKAEKKRYWVCTDTGYQCECRWTNNRFGMIESDEWGWSIFDTPQYTKVVAWMPLPEPYRKEIEDG